MAATHFFYVITVHAFSVEAAYANDQLLISQWTMPAGHFFYIEIVSSQNRVRTWIWCTSWKVKKANMGTVGLDVCSYKIHL